MFSLRNVATKIAFRGASNALKAAKPAMMFAPVAQRSFADYSAIQNGADKLVKALNKEITYEQENYSQLEDIDTFLNESGFAFAETEAGVGMTLSKTVGDKTIEVCFDARQPLPEEEGQEEGQDEEEQGMSENYCDFTIFISNGDGSKGLVVEATSMDTEINFNSVMVSEDLATQRKTHRFERQMKMYAGPDFSTLDERIQTSITEYLEGFGVNEHLAAFVECMSLDKDQRLYMNWLADLHDFTAE